MKKNSIELKKNAGFTGIAGFLFVCEVSNEGFARRFTNVISNEFLK